MRCGNTYFGEGFSGEEADSFVNGPLPDKDGWLKAHVIHVLKFIPEKTGIPGRESLTLGLSHLLGVTITLLPYLPHEPELRSLWLDTTCFDHALHCRGR